MHAHTNVLDFLSKLWILSKEAQGYQFHIVSLFGLAVNEASEVEVLLLMAGTMDSHWLSTGFGSFLQIST